MKERVLGLGLIGILFCAIIGTSIALKSYSGTAQKQDREGIEAVEKEAARNKKRNDVAASLFRVGLDYHMRLSEGHFPLPTREELVDPRSDTSRRSAQIYEEVAGAGLVNIDRNANPDNPESVLAYEAAIQRGRGLVLFVNGKIKEMTLEEFRKQTGPGVVTDPE
jgi:hypothetical protein